MIAVVHGPIGCGKSTALRGWMERRGWGTPRGFRTRFGADGKGRAELRLESWDGRIGVAVASGVGRPGAGGRFDPAFGPLLDGFLDGVFAEEGKCGVRFWGSPVCGVEPLLPEGGECPRPLHSPNADLPWKLDAGRFWAAALECLGGDAGRPVAIDELGVLETMPGGLDLAALDYVVSAIKGTREAILVVQERALPFWRRWLG